MEVGPLVIGQFKPIRVPSVYGWQEHHRKGRVPAYVVTARRKPAGFDA